MKYILALIFMLAACNDTPTSTNIDVMRRVDTLIVVDTVNTTDTLVVVDTLFSVDTLIIEVVDTLECEDDDDWISVP